MKKKTTFIIVLCAVLVVVFGSMLYLKYRPVPENNIEAAVIDTQETESDKVPISKFDRELLETMELISDKGVLSFRKENEEWKVDFSYPAKLDSGAVQDLEYSFSSMYSERIIAEKPDNLSQYGLYHPSVTARATLSDGTAKEFYLGNRTPAGNTYYLMSKDDPRVYAVWMNIGIHFLWELNDFREKKFIVLNMEKFSYLKIVRNGKTLLEVAIMDKPEEMIEFTMTHQFLLKPYSNTMAVNSDAFKEHFLGRYYPLEIEKFVEDNPQSLSPYGLDKPSYEFILKDDENSLHLLLGKTENNFTYFMEAGERSVYAVKKDKFNFLDIRPFNLVDAMISLINIEDADKVTIIGLGRNYTLSIFSKKDGEKESREYTVNGKDIKDKKEFYQSLISLKCDSDYTGVVPNKEPDVCIVFSLNKGKIREYRLDFVPYDEDFYALFKNGKSEFLVARNRLENMMKKMDALMKV